MKKQGRIYAVISVDTEHDILSKYNTKSAGWSVGLPLLFEAFDFVGVRGKVCWLIEYNLKDGIQAANSKSGFFVKEFPGLIAAIKKRGDELGLHPTMYDWLGGDKESSDVSYNNLDLWDTTKSCCDPEFVARLISTGVREFREVCQETPIGCRTAKFHYATYLAPALENNGILIDSSVFKGVKHWVSSPNAYFASRENIWYQNMPRTGVLEIPTTNYIYDGRLNFVLNLRTRYLLSRSSPIFLSFFIHNWQAVSTEGKPDGHFLNSLSSFLCMLKNHGVCFLSWSEARETYMEIYGA